jgi:hypothetical protein
MDIHMVIHSDNHGYSFGYPSYFAARVSGRVPALTNRSYISCGFIWPCIVIRANGVRWWSVFKSLPPPQGQLLRPGAVGAWPGGAVPGRSRPSPERSRPGPAPPSRGSRGPALRRRPGAVEALPGSAAGRPVVVEGLEARPGGAAGRPKAVEARAGGAVQGRSRPGPAVLSLGGRGPAWACAAGHPGAVEAQVGGAVLERSRPGPAAPSQGGRGLICKPLGRYV